MHGPDFRERHRAAALGKLNNNHKAIALEVVGLHIDSGRIDPAMQRARPRQQ